MKKFLIFLLLFPVLALADAVIFSGTDVKALKQNLDLFGVVKVMSGSVDPSAGAGVAAPVGSAYLSTASGLFLKTGVTNTGWTKNALLPVDLTSEVTGVLPIANGGTNLSTVPTNGQLLIGNGTNYTLSGLTGTANQVSVTNGAGSITLSTPQDIATTSNVQFANLNATGTTTLNTGLTGPLKASSGVVSSSAIDLASEVTGTLPIANGGTGSATKNFVDLTTSQTVAGEKTFSNTLKSDSIQTTGSSGVVIKNSSGTTVADFGPANTTNASIVGGLNTGGNIAATGTVTGSNLSGTNTGDTEIGNGAGNIGVAKEFDFPNSQVVQTDSTNKKFRIESGNNNELYNGGFEAETLAVGWTVSNATSSSSTTRIEGSKSLSLALTGALSLSQSSTINASQKSGVQMVASIWVNSSDVSDLQLCSLKNGSEDKCTVTGGYVQGSGWRQLTVSFLGNSTSNGLKLKSTDTTGTVLVDQAYVGIGSPVVDFTPDMVYSAQVSSTGVVSAENTDWISGNASVASGVFTVSFTSGVFTSAPNCNATASFNSDPLITVESATSTSVTVRTKYFNTTAASIPFVIICQKQGADYKTSKAYVASSSDFGYTNAGAITITATTTNPTKGTVVTDRILASRDGQRLIAEYQYQQSSGGSAGSGDYLFTLPFGLSFDSSIVGFYTGASLNSTDISKSVVGYALPNDGSVTSTTSVLVAYDATRFRVLAMWTGSSKSFINSTYFSLGSAQGYSMRLNAPIQGWTDSGVIVGSFQGYNETPGTSRVETFSVSYGTTNATTACSASPCSYLDQIGNAVTSITRGGTGTYSLNLSKTFSKLKCTMSVASSAFNLVSNSVGSGYNCSNCNTLPWTTVQAAPSGGATDSYGSIICQGIPQ